MPVDTLSFSRFWLGLGGHSGPKGFLGRFAGNNSWALWRFLAHGHVYVEEVSFATNQNSG
jgi:hypothetical protein